MCEDRHRSRRRYNQRHHYWKPWVCNTKFNIEEMSGFTRKAPHYGDVPEEELNAVLELEHMKSFLEKVERNPTSWNIDNYGNKVKVPILSTTKQWLIDVWQRYPCKPRRAFSAPPRSNRVQSIVYPQSEYFIRTSVSVDSGYHSDRNSSCDDDDQRLHMNKRPQCSDYSLLSVVRCSQNHLLIVSSKSEGSLLSDIDALEVMLGRC